MSLGILNNIAAVYAQNNLNSTSASLQRTLEQLSSGSRINLGGDDAAGLSIADGLHANEAAIAQSQQNATDGIGLLQTADGALAQVTNLLDRAVTLATQASNGTLTGAQVSSANHEYRNILAQIGNLGSTTNFNSASIFNSSAVSFSMTDGSVVGLNTYRDVVGALSSASVGTTAPVPVTSAVSFAETIPTATTGGTFSFGVSGGATISGGLTLIDNRNPPAIHNVAVFAPGTTLREAVAQWNQTGIAAGFVARLGTSSGGDTFTVTGPAGLTDTLGVGTNLTQTIEVPGAGTDFTAAAVSTLTAGSAATVLTMVTGAIANVAYQRGTIGADINQLTSAANVASSEGINLTSSENSIRATDYGQAASDLSKYEILSQTGVSALAQANSVQQEVLKLLGAG